MSATARTNIFSWILLACLAAATGPLSAQTATTSSLKGRIIDGAGEGIPGVVITLTNPGAAVGTQSLVTDLEGNFAFKLLPPGGGYMLKASIPSFATIVAGPFDLDPGRITVQNLTLKPSSELEETIRVEARGELVDTSSTKTSTTYNAEFIEGLPLLGRRFNDILTLAPGVTDADGDGNPNVRGARDTGLQLRLDGTNVTDPLTGHFGQDINLESIEEIEIITSGASAEYGRADGGFANIITKSGGNDTEGSIKVFYRSDFLDGDGAGNNDLGRGQIDVAPFSDTRAFLTMGGAFVKDHLWYFASVEYLDREQPEIFSTGESALRTQQGWNTFGKVTWQADTDNKLALQLNYDPLEFGGNYIGSRVPLESDFLLRTGGPLVQLKWTSVISPTLLIESLISRLDSGQATLPVSDDFRLIEIEKEQAGNQTYIHLPCRTQNCRSDRSIFTFRRETVGRGRTITSVTGPYFFKNEDQRERTTLKADLSYSIEERLGSHAVKTGFEFNDERYADRPINNPQLTDATVDSTRLVPPIPHLPPSVRFGPLFLDVFDPVQEELRADGLNAGAYLQDSWKPVPNLTINAGLRYDHEEIDSRGFIGFEPLAEAREVLRRFDILCDAMGHPCTSQREAGRANRGLTGIVIPPPGHPALRFDLDGDGDVEIAGAEGAQVRAPLTSFQERLTQGFSVTNSNLAPRFSVSWDPWGDGRTKLFGTWNQYYDRIFLGAVTTEQEPNRFTATWIANGTTAQAEPDSLSLANTGVVSINQVDRDLATPYTIEWSAGFERELAPEWAVTATYVKRRGRNLLQDKDVNHLTCKHFDSAFHVDPMDVCGDGGRLEMDRFGSAPRPISTPSGPTHPPTLGPSRPNGAPDLYSLNTHWNQVLRTGNFNSSRYSSTELALRKRLHRNWQMQFSYTHSTATGEAERFIDLSGNDPAVSEVAQGYLDYDQRHVVKWQGVTHLPHDVILGATVQWASGLPYSRIATVEDQDDVGNLSGQRTFFLSGLKNDQRNEGQWTLNARVEKSLLLGKTHISAFLSGENLLDADDVRIVAVRRGSRGFGVDGPRRFGRRFELGIAFEY